MTDYTAIATAIFGQYDSDHDGNLTSHELRPWYDALLASRPDLGLTSDGYYVWFADIDKNQDGSIATDELAAYLASINYTA
jgi:Ca2+-binding EF-hand superfamily protein